MLFCTCVVSRCIRVVSCCTRVASCCTRVVLVLSHVVSCCTRVVLCCVVLPRVVTHVIFQTRSQITVSKFLLQAYRMLSSAQLPRLASFEKKKISFKSILNNKGASIDPCATLAIIFLQSPRVLFILQHWQWFDR